MHDYADCYTIPVSARVLAADLFVTASHGAYAIVACFAINTRRFYTVTGVDLMAAAGAGAIAGCGHVGACVLPAV